MHVQTKQVSGFLWMYFMTLSKRNVPKPTLTNYKKLCHSFTTGTATHGDQKHILWRLETDIGGRVKNCVCGSIQCVNLTCLCNVI